MLAYLGSMTNELSEDHKRKKIRSCGDLGKWFPLKINNSVRVLLISVSGFVRRYSAQLLRINEVVKETLYIFVQDDRQNQIEDKVLEESTTKQCFLIK